MFIPCLQVHQFGSEPHDIGTPEKVGVRFCSEDRTLPIDREGEKEKGAESHGEAADGGEEGGASTAADAAATGSSDAKSPASVRTACHAILKKIACGFD